MSGWTPHYIEAGVHEKYAPLCLGPAYQAVGAQEFNKAVNV
jgi:1,2-dihydroxy-3-keto-5-methylthiopentene dioxygenase